MTSKVKVNTVETESGSTLTLGKSGDTVTLASGATQSGFGRTGTVDWDTTAKTASFTAVSGNGYFVNTTSGAITVTLPAGSAGSIVSLKDYANTWDTNNVTVTPNGTDKINGANASAILNTQDQSVTLVYVDSTKGWRAVQDSTSDVSGASFIVATGGTVTCCGDYKIHTFTSPGTFCVSSAGNAAGSNSVDYLVVAGGAGGGQGYYGGGGGAGGLRASATTYAIGCNPAGPLVNCVSALPVTATGYPITVGGGGSGAPGTPGNTCKGGDGSNSIFSTITSAGGGGAGSRNSNPNGGNSGGSGGGAADNTYSPFTGGAGNTPPVSPPQGQPGGDYFGGGGGGAKAAGGTISSQPYGGAGGAGAGFTNGAFGSGNGECSSCVQYFSGGGGGGGGSLTGDNSGIGGGGAGGNRPGCAPTPQIRETGTANTGGGGGGGGDNFDSGGAGGSGIVIIRYKYQ